MAGLTRKLQKIFAGSASNNGQFGSGLVGTKVLSADLDVIQALSAYADGWLSAVIDAKKLPPLEEMQALHYMTTTQLAYLFEKGLPEYLGTEEYFTYSICRKVGTYEIYGSKTDNNIGNALPSAVDDANWKYLGDLSLLASVNVPVGSSLDWNSAVAPTGYLIEDGSAISRATYSSLFSAIGSTFGNGDGSTTFNIPDSRGKVSAGYQPGTNEFGTLGGNYGAKTHTLSTAEIPSHNHSYYRFGQSGGSEPGASVGGGGTFYSTYSTTTGSLGSGSAHNNIQPSIIKNKIIKY